MKEFDKFILETGQHIGWKDFEEMDERERTEYLSNVFRQLELLNQDMTSAMVNLTKALGF